MGDMDRQDVLREVHRKLINPEFSRRFTATSADGSKPIVVAMLEDTIADLAGRVLTVGGAANVVTPFMNTLLVYALRSEQRVVDGPKNVTDSTLNHECTVGLFIARVAEGTSAGGPQTFNFFVKQAAGSLPCRVEDDDAPGLVLTTPV